MATAAETRRITSILEEYNRYTPGKDAEHGVVRSIDLSRMYNRRRYFVSYRINTTTAGIHVLIDTTAREYWIRPAERVERNYSELGIATRSHNHLDRTHLVIARETRILDALFDELDAQGYTPARWSETRESLETYRAQPRPEFLG